MDLPWQQGVAYAASCMPVVDRASMYVWCMAAGCLSCPIAQHCRKWLHCRICIRSWVWWAALAPEKSDCSWLLVHLLVHDTVHQFRPVLAGDVASTLGMTVCNKLATRFRCYVMCAWCLHTHWIGGLSVAQASISRKGQSVHVVASAPQMPSRTPASNGIVRVPSRGPCSVYTTFPVDAD